MKKTWIMRSGVVVVLLVALTALYARGRAPLEEDNGPEHQLVERRSLEVTAEAAGVIEPIRLVEVKSKASGEILRLAVESGDAVRRGDLLGQIDPRDVRNALAQAEADLDVAQARLETAQSARRRSAELREANVITEQEFESAKLEEANARAQYVKARTNLELAQERMGDVTIRAPIDGVIIRKDVETGQIIQSASQNISGGTTVFVMADLNEMQVRTLVSETDLGRIQPGMTARVSVEAFPGRNFSGTVTKIEPQAVVEQNVTMFPVLVHLSNQDGALKPGMNAEVIVEVARREDAVTVPNAAVVALRDAVAAGALFGIGEDQMRTALRAGRGTMAQPAGEGGGEASPASSGTTTAAAAAAGEAPGSGPAAGAAAPAVDAGTAAGGGTALPGNGPADERPALSAECQALRERVQQAGGFAGVSDEDRARLRECVQAARAAGGTAGQGAGRGAGRDAGGGVAGVAAQGDASRGAAGVTGRGDGGRAAAGTAGATAGEATPARPSPAAGMQAGSGTGAAQSMPAAAQAERQGRSGRNRGVGGGDVRAGVVFVQTASGIEPRTVLLGVNDWDYTEVLRGVEPGEHVVLISVARLQQQQQEMLNRFRERAGGPFPGASGPGGGRGGR